ncbi:MAG: hypothetical protein AAGC97_06875, partial [Planctomycetota bacterium]
MAGCSAAVLMVAFSVTPSAAEEGPASKSGTLPSRPVVSGPEPLLSNVRLLTFEGRRAGEGYFSADGTQMVFQSERDP